MGYPMDYVRVVSRNQLHGDYHYPISGSVESVRGMIAGDLRRLEKDQRDDAHLSAYAKVAGITMMQAKAVLDAFFGGVVLIDASRAPAGNPDTRSET